MNILQAFAEIRNAAKTKQTSINSDKIAFQKHRRSLLSERSTVQQLHAELQAIVERMSEHTPQINCHVIRITEAEAVKYLPLATVGLRARVRPLPEFGQFRIDRTEDVLL